MYTYMSHYLWQFCEKKFDTLCYVPYCFLFQLVIASVVVGTLSVTALAYLDLRSQINEKQSQLNNINTKMAAQDDKIATLTSSVSALSVRHF